MQIHARSVAIGAVLALGTGALVSAQAIGPAARIVADLLAVKVQGPVTVRQEIGEVVDLRFLSSSANTAQTQEQFLLYTVPEGKRAFVRSLQREGCLATLLRLVDPTLNVNDTSFVPPDLEVVAFNNLEVAFGAPSPPGLVLAPGEELWASTYVSGGDGQQQGTFRVLLELVPEP